MAKTFDSCCSSIGKLIDGVSGDGGAVSKKAVNHPGMGASRSTDGAVRSHEKGDKPDGLCEPVEVVGERDVATFCLLWIGSAERS
jgi:hypothetical protein